MSALWVASYIVLWVLVAALAMIVMGLLRQLGLIQLRLGPDSGMLITTEGLDRGTPAPDFEAIDLQTHKSVRLSSFRGRRVVLVFLTPTCIACRQLVPNLNDVAHEQWGEIAMLAVCHGSETTCGEFAGGYRLKIPLLLDATNDIGTAYDVHLTPFAYLIDENGIVRIRGVANSWPQLEALINEEGTVAPASWESMTGQTDQLMPAGVDGAGKVERVPASQDRR